MASSQFKIRVGTELDTSGLKSQFNAAVKELENQKVKIQVDDSEVKDIITSFKKIANSSSNTIKLNTELNTNASQLRSKLKRDFDTIKPEVEVEVKYNKNDVSKISGEVSREITKLNKLISQNSDKTPKFNQMSAIKDTLTRDAAALRNVYGQIADEINDIYSSINDEMSNAQLNSLDKQISSLENKQQQIARTLQAINDTFIEFKGIDADVAYGDALSKESAKLKNAAKEAEQTSRAMSNFANQVQQEFNKITSVQSTTKLDLSIANLDDNVKKLGNNISTSFSQAVHDVKTFEVAFKSAVDAGNISETISQYHNLIDAIRTAQVELKKNNSAFKDLQLQQKKTNILQNSDLWLKDNPKIKGTKLEDQIIQYRIEIDASQSVKEVDLLNAKLKSVQKEAQLQGLAGNTFFGNLASKAKEVASYLATFGPMWEIQQGIQQMAQNVLEVDTAMTGLYRVTDMTEKEYDQLYSNMISSAREYGATLTDTINATSDWIRAGFENPQQALDLGGITTMYQHVSDLDYDEATKNLLTAYNGFKDTFKETFAGDDVAAVEHVADVYNELDNQFSITSAGLGEGLARSASALELAGNTFEEAAALVGATAEVTQDPEKAGNAMKVLSLRLRGMKGQLEELGEDSEGVENISKMQGQILNLTKGKVNIFGDNGEFKSTYDIMKDISEVYNDMTDTDRASLLETIAGKDRANDVAALLGNMDNAVAMVETAENAVGSASRENEKYLDSLQGRIDVMQGSFQALSNVVIDSGFLKGGVSAIDNIIKAVTILIENLGLLPTALAAVAAGFALFGKKVVSFDDATNSVKLFGKELGSIKNIFSSVKNGLGDLFSGNKSLIDFGLDSFESELDKKKKEIDKGVESLKKYKEIQTSTDLPDYQKKTLSDIELAKMPASAKEYATSVDAACLAEEEWAASEMKLATQIELTSKSLRSQLTLLKEYNSAQKKGAGARTGKTTKEISEQVNGTELGSTAVGSIIAGAKGGEVKVGKALGSLVTKGAKTALKGLAGTVASAFTGILGGLIANFAIDGLFKGIEWLLDNTVNKAKKAAEAVEAMNEKFAETKSTLNNSKQVVSEYGDLYAELSKGVNTKTNENIGLSTDEYSQYLDIVNQISQTFPELVSGYDAQGNAILTCAGNLNTLNEAYNAQAIEKYNEVLKESGSAFEDFTNKRKDLEAGFFDDIGAFFDSADLNMDGYKKLKEMMSSETGESIDDIVDSLTWGESDDIYEALDKAGANFDSLLSVNDNIKNVAKEQPELVRQVISGFESSMSSASEGLKNIAQAYIGKAFVEGDYSNISDSMQTVLTNAISGLDYDFFSQFDSDKDMEAELDNILSAFNSLNDADKKTMEMSFDLQTKLNNGDISVSEYLSSIENVGSIIDGMNLDKETKKALRLQFDIDDNYIQEQYDNLTKELTKNGFAESEVKSWLDSLSGTDLSIAATLDLEGKDSIQDLQEALDLAKALQGVGSIDIAVETEGFEKLNTAITESNSAIGLSQDSIDAISNRYANLEGFDPAAIFEKTTTGVRLNTEALNSMENQLIATNKAANAKNLSVLAKRAKELEESISAANAAGEDTSGFEAQLETIRESIQDAQMAAAAYDGLTSAYKGWVDAQSAGQQGDMYNSILTGMENATELANANKWGNTELQEFIKMFSGEGSMDTATPQQFADAWGSAISKAQRYFAEGTQGIDNFFADIQSKNAELLTEENGVLNFAPNVEVEDVAEALGIAESTVEAIVGMANEYGADIKIGVEQQSLDELVVSSEKAAQEASDALKSALGEDFEISYDLKVNEDGTSNAEAELEKLKAKRDEINNSDATVKVKEQGVEAVNAQIESLIREKIQLEQPAFMSLDTSQVSASMVDALGKIQEMQKALDNLSALNQMQEAGISVDTSDIDAAQAKVDECAQAIAGLDGNVKVALGLEEDGSIDSIIQDFKDNKVDIEVGADATSAKSATEELADTIDKIEDKDVTITVTVDGINEVRDLGKVFDAATSITGDIEGLSKFAEAAKGLKDIDDNITKNVVVNISGNLGENTGASYALSNLDAFVEGAKNLKEVEDTNVTVTANLEGNLGLNLGIDNLEKFADGANKLDDVESKTVDVTANLHGNLGLNLGVDNLKKFAEGAEAIEGIESSSVDVTANLYGNIIDDSTIDNLKQFSDTVNSLSSTTVNVDVNANTESITQVKTSLQSLSNSGVMKDYTASVKVNVDSSAISSLQSAINNVQTKAVTVTASVAGTPAVTALQTAIANVTAKTVGVTANVTGTSEVNALTAAIDKVNSKSVSVTASVLGTPNVNALASAIASVKSKTVTVTARYTTSGSLGGANSLNGTAHADGTANTGKAFKQGKWGAEESGTALMGELGPEIIVRGDKWFTVGDNGAGFYQYKKGDIIFNHLQSEELLKNGYVTSNGGRGRAFAEGTAFLEGKAFASLVGGWKPGGIKPSGSSGGGSTVVNNVTNNYNYSSVKSGSSKSSSSSSKAKKEADEFSETLDWIEIAIDRIERALDNLDTVASSTYRSWSERTDALNQQMTVTRQEIDLQQRAYERYMQEANSVGLSADWIEKIQNGMINLETITDEALNDQIEKYKEYYEAALDSKDAVVDLTEALGDLAAQKFENVQSQFDGVLGSLEYEQSMVENYVDRAEVDGQFVSKNFYRFLQDNVHAQAEALREQVKQLISTRDELVNSGALEVGGEEWNDWNNQINDVTVSIHELGTQWAEYAKAMRETEWDIFDTVQDRISGIADEAQFLIDLMSNKKLFEDNGQLTNEGMASIGLYGEQYNILMNQADRYAEEIKKLEEQMAKEPFGPDAYGNASNAFNQDIIDRYYELIEAQQEAILSAEDMKNSIKDLVSEGIDLELQHLDDLIDKYLEALQAQKD